MTGVRTDDSAGHASTVGPREAASVGGPTADFTIELIDRDPLTSVGIGGELDLSTSLRLRDQLDLLVDEAPGDVFVDMSAVVFMDSAAIRELVGAHRACAATGGRLFVVNPSPSVRRILDLTGLLDTFGVEAS